MVSDRSDMSKVRIGILGNNENNLVTCDSRIGSGSGRKHNNDVILAVTMVSKPWVTS